MPPSANGALAGTLINGTGVFVTGGVGMGEGTGVDDESGGKTGVGVGVGIGAGIGIGAGLGANVLLTKNVAVISFLLPAKSMALIIIGWLPAGIVLRVINQLPYASALAMPYWPSHTKISGIFGSVVPPNITSSSM